MGCAQNGRAQWLYCRYVVSRPVHCSGNIRNKKEGRWYSRLLGAITRPNLQQNVENAKKKMRCPRTRVSYC